MGAMTCPSSESKSIAPVHDYQRHGPGFSSHATRSCASSSACPPEANERREYLPKDCQLPAPSTSRRNSSNPNEPSARTNMSTHREQNASSKEARTFLLMACSAWQMTRMWLKIEQLAELTIRPFRVSARIAAPGSGLRSSIHGALSRRLTHRADSAQRAAPATGANATT